MIRSVESSITPDSVPTTEIKRWETITKPAPYIGALLDTIEDTFTARGLGQVICDASHEFDKAYTGWQTVRLFRSPGVIGNTQLASGFEGYYAGLDDPRSILNKQARLGQLVLDADTRNNPYKKSRRNAIDAVIYGRSVTSGSVLGTLYEMFSELRSRAQIEVATSPSEYKKRLNKAFHDETRAYVVGSLPLTFKHLDDKFEHIYSLPAAAKTPPVVGINESDVLSIYRDGFNLVKMIGIMGHPVMHRIQKMPQIMSRLSEKWAYYPEKRTEKRQRLDMSALSSVLVYLSQYANSSVENFVSTHPSRSLITEYMSAIDKNHHQPIVG